MSIHNTIFFHECQNYKDNGSRVTVHGNPSQIVREATDNSYETYSTQTDLSCDISDSGNATRVDAVYLLSTGVTTHTASATGGVGTGYAARTIPTTIQNYNGTDVSTTFNGYQHDLYLLDTHFTATDVRIRFTGNNVRIYALMLLSIGLELNANKRDFASISGALVSRTSQVRPRSRGRIRRVSQIGAARDKWQVDMSVRVIPDRTTLEDVQTLVDWRASNPNFAFVQEYSRFPARGCFPSVWLGDVVSTRLRGRNRRNGYVQSVSVGEA